MASEENRGASDIWEFRRDIKGIRADLDALKKDMWIGNGKPGVTTRLLQLEGAVDRLEATLAKFENTLDRVLTDPNGIISRINTKIDNQNKYIWIGIGILVTLQFVAPIILKELK